MKLTVSCVIYNSDPHILQSTLGSLSRAAGTLKSSGGTRMVALDLIDNSLVSQLGGDCLQTYPNILTHIYSGHGNIGFGAGHNLSIKNAESQYHLVLNPDVILDGNALNVALQFMDENPDVVVLSPESKDPVSGNLQFQCKAYPSLLVLALRLLNVPFLNRIFSSILSKYEERVRILSGQLFDAEIVSGCFMLFRTEALKRLGGFDDRYFLYFEDFDLSLRSKKLGRVVYHPSVKIMHYGGGAGRKGMAHIKMFCRSAITFFNQHGWTWF